MPRDHVATGAKRPPTIHPYVDRHHERTTEDGETEDGETEDGETEDGETEDGETETRDIEALKQRYTTFIREAVDDADADGVVVAVSGGIDSTTTATLAVEALGTNSVYGLVLPTDASAEANMADAKRVVWNLGINFRTVDLQPLLEQFTGAMHSKYELRRSAITDSSTRLFDPAAPAPKEDRTEAAGNAAARLRMMAAYYEANTTNRLVLGTGNRTELLLGYFTKHGDGGADLHPLGDLYKTEVRALARHLDVPERIVTKPPTAGLWDGQTDESELGESYETIDAILGKLVDEGESVERTAEALDVDCETVERFATMYEGSAHKRTVPPTPASGSSTDP